MLQCLQRGEGPPKAAWSPPANISKWVGGAFADHGCEVHYTVGEADREMVRSGLGLGSELGLGFGSGLGHRE